MYTEIHRKSLELEYAGNTTVRQCVEPTKRQMSIHEMLNVLKPHTHTHEPPAVNRFH